MQLFNKTDAELAKVESHLSKTGSGILLWVRNMLDIFLRICYLAYVTEFDVINDYLIWYFVFHQRQIKVMDFKGFDLVPTFEKLKFNCSSLRQQTLIFMLYRIFSDFKNFFSDFYSGHGKKWHDQTHVIVKSQNGKSLIQRWFTLRLWSGKYCWKTKLRNVVTSLL